MYADRVVVEYDDIADPQVYERRRALLERVPEDYLIYPLVFIDNELTIAGSAEFYQIVYAVRDLLA